MTDALPGDTGIRTPDQRLRVFVNSTLAELAEDPRRRAGVRVWGSARGEAERVTQIRQALGADRFDEVFAAGSRLNQQDAVAAVRDRHGEGVGAS